MWLQLNMCIYIFIYIIGSCRGTCWLGISAVHEPLKIYCVTHQLVVILNVSPFAVPVQAAGNVAGDERAARQGVRAAGCDRQRAGDHQREAGAGEQGLTAEDRQVIDT